MKRRKRESRWIWIISMLWVFVCTMPITAEAAQYSGITGDVEYEFREGTLYLYSEEENAVMPNYQRSSDVPWENWKNDITTIIINNHISNIGEFAFENCENLEKVEIKGNDLRNIGIYSFYNCIRLKSIKLPEGVTEIGAYSFYNCISLESSEDDMWTFPSTLQKIGFNAFQRCTKLAYLVLPSSLQWVDSCSFSECNFLEKVRIQDQGELTYFPENVFLGCESVEIYVYKKGYLWNKWSDKSQLKPIYILSDDNSIYEFLLNGQAKCVTEYTGEQICPDIEVRKNGTLLIPNTDYKVSYENNREVGKGQAIITGIHQYEGVCRVEFDIVKKDDENADNMNIADKDANDMNTGNADTDNVHTDIASDVTTDTVKMPDGSNEQKKDDDASNDNTKKNIRQCKIKFAKVCNFTGKIIKPVIKVYDKNTLLKKGRDYNVTYANNMAVGKKAKIVIKGIGEYKGKKTCYFSIVMPKPVIKVQVQKEKQVKIQLKNVLKNCKVYVYYKADKDKTWSTPRVYTNKKVIRLTGKKNAQGKVKIRVRYVWKKEKSAYSKISEVVL